MSLLPSSSSPSPLPLELLEPSLCRDPSRVPASWYVFLKAKAAATKHSSESTGGCAAAPVAAAEAPSAPAHPSADRCAVTIPEREEFPPTVAPAAPSVAAPAEMGLNGEAASKAGADPATGPTVRRSLRPLVGKAWRTNNAANKKTAPWVPKTTSPASYRGDARSSRGGTIVAWVNI
ncbi:hypothetical protein Vafri_7504 [Volvox africanus]|uniref:Uncharacterized protein n=1 Tax=Volvox africanus TaxID=51714 RepID=A0A8J4EZA7_9CHLO|nr:hypothetical protein Vafri_7504 [Volvox africanus]